MVSLTRTVRFAINSASPSTPAPRGQPTNTFAGFPSLTGLGRHYELDVRCQGFIDPATGYFVNIKQIDQAVRATAIPIIERAAHRHPAADPAHIILEFLPALNAALHNRVAAVRWRLTPYHSVEMAPPTATTAAAPTNTPASATSAAKEKGGAAPPIALLRQQFELAAAHRLHIPTLSDEENRRLFGKCNSPSGHGHNYRVEPCIAVPLDADPRSAFTLADLERITNDTIISRFDHTHLNVDTPEFNPDRGGVNPSVENIARVFFNLLAPAIRSAAPNRGVELRSVTVWETDKTSCTYPV